LCDRLYLSACGFDGDEGGDACEIVCDLRTEGDGGGFAGAGEVMSGDFGSVIPESAGSRSPIGGFSSFFLSAFGHSAAFDGREENAANGFTSGLGSRGLGDGDGDVAAGLDILKHD